MSCKPGPGTYNILSNIDSNAVNTCPPNAPADVVILDDVAKVGLAAREYMTYAETYANRLPSRSSTSQPVSTTSRSMVDMSGRSGITTH